MGTEAWSTPINLSQSGAASTPTAIPTPDGGLRIFWWDRIDGLTMVTGMSGEWSATEIAPIFIVEALERPAADGSRSVSTPIADMPSITGDIAGNAHAIWLGETDTEDGTSSLFYARMSTGQTAWTTARAVAESATAFVITADASGFLHVAYVRNLHTGSAPSGITYIRSNDGGRGWSQPVIVHSSLYYRLATLDLINLSIAADADDNVVLTWNDPHLLRALMSQSTDGGENWLEPVVVGGTEAQAANPRPFMTPENSRGNAWVLWEGTDSLGGCVLRQAPTDELIAGKPVVGQRVLEGFPGCPSPVNERLLSLGGDRVVMLSGGGTGTLALGVQVAAAWSEPKWLTFRFDDPLTETPIYLEGLYGTLTQPISVTETVSGNSIPDNAGGMFRALAVVGIDAAGDVWLTQSRLDALELAFAPPSPWSAPSALSPEPSAPDLPAVVADSQGWIHALWAEAETSGQAGKVLRYARWNGSGWTRPTTVVEAAGGSSSEPSLAVTEERLHAVWRSGPDGRILYSRAFLQDAYTASGWEEPRPLPGPTAAYGLGGQPQIVSVTGGSHRLHAIYAVPVNEDRGIYYTYSDDAGETWSEVAQVFDAINAGWAIVDHPRFAVAAMGGLHVIWTRPSLSADGPPRGIYYAHSVDGGRTWSEAHPVAEGAYTWPEIATDGLGGVHLFWAEASGARAWWYQASTSNGPDGLGGWTRASRVPGFSNTRGPIGIVGDGALGLQLTGLGTASDGEPALLYLTWAGEAGAGAGQDPGAALGVGEWGGLETYRLDPAPAPATAGIVAALQLDLQRLNVFYRAVQPVADGDLGGADGQTTLWHTGRAVSVTTLGAEFRPVMPNALVAEVAPTPVMADSVASAPDTAMPTRDFATTTPPATENLAGLVLPLLVGGGLAAAIVVSVFVAMLLARSRRHAA